MGCSKTTASAALLLTLTLLLLFTLSTACCCCRQTPCPPSPKPKPGPRPGPPSSRGKCPMDALKLGVCANVLDGLLNVTIGKPPKEPCCSLIQNLVDLEAAVCLCTAIKANLLGINLNIPVDLSLLLNYCGKKVPTGFQCP